MKTPATAMPEEHRLENSALSATPTIAAPAVGETLSPAQQQGMYQELVRVCRHLLSREVQDERPA